MDLKELKKKLCDQGVPKEMYNFSDELPNEQFCLISKANSLWEVYYSERGCKSDLHTFSSESAACEFFFLWVTKTAKNHSLF